MADFWKDSPNAPKLSDVRTVISQLRAWSENQRQKFLNKQLIEHQNLLEHSGIRKLELQLNQQQSHEDNNDEFAKNEKGKNVFDRSISESENTQDSSVTGHILRCFSDSSFDSSNLNGNKDSICEKTAVPIREFVSSNDNLPREVQDLPDTINSIPKRPKQPFLKKRSGLLRYMPKQNKNVTKHNKITELQDSDFETQRKTCLKLKPAFQSIKLPHNENHEQFGEPDLFIYTKNSHPNKTPQKEVKSTELFDRTEPRNLTNSGENEEKSENPNFDKINSCDDSINTETKELAEFEMLESCAQNSSFNSDSSVVQRVLQVKSVQPMYKIPKPDFPSDPEIISDQLEKPFTNPTISGKLNFEKFLEEQQHLEDLILDTDRKIDSLQEKTNSLNKNAFEEKRDLIGERCSTPVEQKNVLSATVSDTDLHKESRSSIFVTENDYAKNIEGLNAGAKKNIFPEERYESKMAFQDDKDTFPMESDEFDIKSTFNPNLRQKMEELEKEIQIYQKLNSELEKEKQTYKEHNARLIVIRKDRDENLKNLQKGWDELQKHKEEEEKKLEAKAKQLKMREETYNRYQKLRQDNPTRKEREELSVLRQEVEKLQEELKKQRIRFTNENKRLKNQLVAAEHERDTLKLENITLEEQCQDLLTVLKTRNIKKKPAAQTKDTHRNKKNITSKPNPNQDLNEPSDSSESITKKSSSSEKYDKNDINNAKLRVRFNLVPQFEKGVDEPTQNSTKDVHSNMSENSEESDIIIDQSTVETGNKSEKNESPYEERKHGDEIERIYSSGEKEIIRPSGVIKHISADGHTIKYLYPNGDEKEICSDNTEIRRFTTGVVEKRFPGGVEVTEHPNGQIERRSPGLEEVKFPDGTTQTRFFYSDGSEKIVFDDGTQVTLDPDGTKVAEFKNGIKEIVTDEYMRKEYPNGSIKIVHADGSQETRFSNGRVRIKDNEGRVVLDTKLLQDELGYSCNAEY